MRTIECGPSYVLVKQTNSFRIDKDRCTIHLNLSVSHVVAEQLTLDLSIVARYMQHCDYIVKQLPDTIN